MDVVEKTIVWLQHLSPLGVMVAIFLIAYIENIFPPSPSDVLLVFAGTLIGLGTVGFVPALIVATLGSTLGFMTAYAPKVTTRASVRAAILCRKSVAGVTNVLGRCA